jgi:hypothetical protein
VGCPSWQNPLQTRSSIFPCLNQNTQQSQPLQDLQQQQQLRKMMILSAPSFPKAAKLSLQPRMSGHLSAMRRMSQVLVLLLLLWEPVQEGLHNPLVGQWLLLLLQPHLVVAWVVQSP